MAHDQTEADTPHGTDRPTNCQCSSLMTDLGCWPCWRGGFKTPNPHPPTEAGDGD